MKWDEATEEAEIAYKMETNNIVSTLMLTALNLKQSENTNCLAKARTYINETSAILNNMSDINENKKRWREATLNVAIYCALCNWPEYAKKMVNLVENLFPDDDVAKDILKAID